MRNAKIELHLPIFTRSCSAHENAICANKKAEKIAFIVVMVGFIIKY
jgi:hypothetical protein